MNGRKQNPEINIYTFIYGKVIFGKMPRGFYLSDKCLGLLDIHMQKPNLDPASSPCIKVNSKWITELNGRAKLENFEKKIEDRGENLCDLGLDKNS